jgi:outer membrane receptor protein involved in Fe transport
LRNRRLIAFVTTWLGVSAVHADPAVIHQSASGDQKRVTLDTISVTANRDQELTLEVPASIGVVDAKTLERDQPHYQKDVFNSIAGVRVTQTGSTLGHMTSIRMPSNTGPYYLFLQDGIPLQSSGFFNHNGLAYANFSSAASAEVLKGAGTALYGSDAIAGTINVITRDPTLEKGTAIRSDLGSDGFYRVALSGSSTLKNASSLGFQLMNSGSEGWRDHTRTKRSEASMTHFMSPDDNNSFKTVFAMNTTEANMAGSLIGLDELYNNTESVGDIQAALDTGLEIQRKFDFARLSTEWTHFLKDSIELSSIAYLRSNRNRYVATWERNLPASDTQTRSAGLMFKMNIEQDRLRWIVGNDIEYTQAENTYTQQFDYVPSGFGSSVPKGAIYDYEVDYVALSPYASVALHVTEAFTLEAGLRYDHYRYEYTNNLTDGQYASSGYARASSDRDPSFDHWSPKLSASYRLDDQQALYARFANGFRIPQASRLYSLKTNNIDFDLEPEVSDTYELGYKFANDSLRLDLAVYHMSIEDTIVSRENLSGDEYFVNGGETRHKGIELSVLQKLSADISARLAYAYSEHKFVNDSRYKNNEQADAPNDTANFRLLFHPQQTPGLSLSYEIEYVGKYWLDDDNTRSYDGYTLTHLKGQYDVSKNLGIHAKINNLTNKIYAENASVSYGKEKYTPGAPRQFYAGIDYRF